MPRDRDGSMPRPEASTHTAYVDAWLNRVVQTQQSLPARRLIALFERAMGALWERSQATLGEVTVAAIVDRVLYTASEKYPILSTLKIEGTRIRFDELQHQSEGLSPICPRSFASSWCNFSLSSET